MNFRGCIIILLILLISDGFNSRQLAAESDQFNFDTPRQNRGKDLFAFTGFAENEKKGVMAEKASHDRKIAMLPFYNYSDSELKYLSTYIPELIAGDISRYGGIMIYNPESLAREITQQKIIPEDLYNREEIMLKFLRGMDADLGLFGRYIIQGKSIRIDFRLVDVKSGKIDKGYAYSGIMDENLLVTLDKYSKSRAEWIVEHVLTDVIKTSGATERGRYEKYLGKIRDSRVGLFIYNKWIFAGLIIMSFYLLGAAVSFFFNKYFPKIPRIAKTSIDDKVIGKIRKILKRVIILLGCKVVLVALEITPNIYNFLNDVLSAIIIILAAYAAVIIIEISLSSWGSGFANNVNPRVSRDLMPLFITLIKIFIASIVVIIILSKFDIDIAPFLASIGIMGIAIGFAVKDSLADIIGGIFLAMDQSIAAGDLVTIDGDTGYIKEVGIRNTSLLTFDNELIVYPNGELSKKKFKNFVLPDPRYRVVVNFSAAYGSDVDRVEEVVLEAVKKIDQVLKDPEPVCIFEEMGDFSLNFQIKFWIPDYNAMFDKKKEATRIIYKALMNAGIDIPFPTHTVYVKKD